MYPAERAFLRELIDYAGLFPPAALDLDAAIRNFAQYRESTDHWMLARFICPASRLGELVPYGEELFASGEPFRFSVLGQPVAEWEELPGAVATSLATVGEFVAHHGGRVLPDAFETRLPPGLPGRRGVLEDLAARVDALGGGSGPIRGRIQFFFEANPGPGEEVEAMESLVVLLAGLNASRPAAAGLFAGAGFKLRCGGLTPELYPAVETVVAALDACHRHRVPFKATAGLHHPLRHFRSDLKVHEYGFLNVFGAGVLLATLDLDRKSVREILAEEDPRAFRFDEEGFHWRELSAGADQIARARREAMLSYGSCSFDEPREDLRHLGYLSRDPS